MPAAVRSDDSLRLQVYTKMQSKATALPSQKQADILLDASAKCNTAVLTTLLEHGVDVRLKNEHGESALHKAAQGNMAERSRFGIDSKGITAMLRVRALQLVPHPCVVTSLSPFSSGSLSPSPW